MIDSLMEAWARLRRRGKPPASVDEMIPSSDLFSVGGGDFKAVGVGLFSGIRDSCGLRPEHHVLDIGCGTGRVAVHMTQFLSKEGRYEGFDTAEVAVRHCRRNITPSYPHFRFLQADLYNKQYNPRGAISDAEFRFPYPDASFDVVFATSVFTHLLPAGARRYLLETARVLKPGGRFLATYFLLNAESLASLEAGKSTLGFPHVFAEHRVENAQIPEIAVAYQEDFIMGLYREAGLEFPKPTDYGSWCGRASGSYQDAIVARRPAAP